MRILYLIDTLEVGGAEKSLLEIVRRFRTGQAVICHLYPGHALRPAYQQAGVAVISLDIPGKYAFKQAVSEVARVAKRERPDLIHTTLFRSDMVGRWVGRRLGVPVISSFVSEPYGPVRQRRLDLVSRIKLRGVQGLDMLSARWASQFVANSETIRAANAQALGVPVEKVSVIYRGRDPVPFLQETPGVIAWTRNELGLGPEDRVILNVARLVERKGQAELIRAMPAILASFPQARLLLVGEGPYRPALESLIEEMGLGETVRLFGQRDDIPELLHVTEVFCFPSHYEGWPGALVEAMLAGLPLVASDTPVHREAISDGKTGRLVTVGSPKAVAGGVLEILQEPDRAKEMGEQARQLAMERFHIDRIAAQHEALYERVLGEWVSR